MTSKRALGALAGVTAVVGSISAQPAADVDDLLARMTVEHKLAMVSGTAALDDAPPLRVPGAAGSTLALPELGLPQLVLADGPAGLRIAPTRAGDDATYYATAFPIATALASTWDVELLGRVGEAMGREAKEYGVDVLLAPAMNVHRNPLTGRNFEYFTEDPYLNGHVAAALVRGVQSTGVGATLKHFAANNQETNRFLLDTLVDERALREIYLRGFEIAVRDSQPRAIMGAYNKINGRYSTQSHELMTGILRGDWGYEGLVMTDWFAGNDAVAQIEAGTDLLMPGTEQQTAQLREALGERLEAAALDRAVRNVLGAVVASPAYAGYAYGGSPDLEAQAAITRRAAAEAAVLLKNDNGTLPLDAARTIVAAFGNTSYGLISGGSGSGDVNEAYTVSLVDGLRAQAFRVNEQLEETYRAYIEERRSELPEPEGIFAPGPRPEEMRVPRGLIERMAREASVAIVTLGRVSGEFADRELEGGFHLTVAEQRLVHSVAEVFHAEGKPVVTILNVGNVVETATWRGEVDAILVPWQGGQEAGNAIADVLSGRASPSGKLPMTFPLRYSHVPSADNFPGELTDEPPVEGWSRFSTGRPSEVRYAEGIYVGYRHYATFDVPVAYEFGFGLSYTTFEYGDMRTSGTAFGRAMTVSLDVTNTGGVPGREVVQLYLSEPESRIDKPALELEGFAKTRRLAPGATQTLEFELNARSLASFDRARSAWIADAGEYTVHAGASSQDLRAQVRFTLAEPIAEPAARALVLERTLDEAAPR